MFFTHHLQNNNIIIIIDHVLYILENMSHKGLFFIFPFNLELINVPIHHLAVLPHNVAPDLHVHFMLAYHRVLFICA